MSVPFGRSSWHVRVGGSGRAMPDDPFALLSDAGAACDEAGVAYAVIGAVARNAWAPPRATADIDLATIIPDRAANERLMAAFARRGIEVAQVAASGDEPVPDLIRLERPTGVVRRLDILVAKTPFEVEAVSTATTFDLGGPHRRSRAGSGGMGELARRQVGWRVSLGRPDRATNPYSTRNSPRDS
jgi:hypothetical protein